MAWVVVDDQGHWLWQGSTNHGYGRFSVSGRNMQAHRMAWELFRGPVPDGMHVHHVCYVRACVNPEHLEPITPRANQNDQSPLRPPRKPKSPHKHRKAVCKNGHPMDGDNIAWTKAHGKPVRYCRECSRENNRRMAAKRKAQH